MAEKPVAGGREPIAVEVRKGDEYWWCACGRSKTQPFCDGSHAGTGIEPLRYAAERDRTVYFCTCKATGRSPVCDGSHSRLPG